MKKSKIIDFFIDKNQSQNYMKFPEIQACEKKIFFVSW